VSGGGRRRQAPACEPSILRLGENCCAIARAPRVAVLVDGAAYFDAFRRAAERAQRSIVVLAWDFDSRTPVAWDDARVTLRLGDFLNALARRRRALEIRVLTWDYPLLYGLEREPPPVLGLGWRTHRRVRVRYDGTHPFTASQHQKMVVVDDRVAFVGGLDLASRRWDTSVHSPRDPRRVWEDEPYPPFHDVMAVLDGEAVHALGEIARWRWRRATGERLEAVEVGGDPWPPGLRPDFHDACVGVARTVPADTDLPPTREVEQLYLDMIENARSSVYLENQYFTSDRVGEALAAKLSDADGPEVVVVTRLLSHGWLEEYTMHRLRSGIVNRLRAADRHGRFHVLYPHVPGLARGTCVDLHSKLAVVDDEWLRVGSANLSNRSMGLDTECDVVVEAAGRVDVREAIRATRDRLLAEHLGVPPSEVAAHVRRAGNVAGAIAALRSAGRTLRPLEAQPALPAQMEAAVAAAADPERPVSLEELLGQFGPGRAAPARSVPRRLIAIAGMAAAVGVAWWLSPLGDLAQAAVAAGLVREAAGRWWLAPLLVIAYTPGSFVLFPRQVITLSAAVAYGPSLALLLALSGNLLAACAGYGAGKRFPRDAVRRVAGGRLNSLSELLRGQGLVTLSALRLVPLGPYAVQNVVAGATRVPFLRFLAATLVGILPGSVATSLLGDQLRLVLLNGADLDVALVVALAACLLLCAAAARWVVFRRRRRPSAATTVAGDQARDGAARAAG
jgi:phosphatidylserine/phosphatidylglycerophosphate/cardiolipin synthase-like enzyme/uncharacterized membrane protein YdjX (TVP38/TMEM64 family)